MAADQCTEIAAAIRSALLTSRIRHQTEFDGFVRAMADAAFISHGWSKAFHSTPDVIAREVYKARWAIRENAADQEIEQARRTLSETPVDNSQIASDRGEFVEAASVAAARKKLSEAAAAELPARLADAITAIQLAVDAVERLGTHKGELLGIANSERSRDRRVRTWLGTSRAMLQHHGIMRSKKRRAADEIRSLVVAMAGTWRCYLGETPKASANSPFVFAVQAAVGILSPTQRGNHATIRKILEEEAEAIEARASFASTH